MHRSLPIIRNRSIENMKRAGLAAALFVATSAALFVAPSALACGGFFCSTAPVEQNAERILFEVHPPPVGVTAVVEISYTGDPGAFSWIVPVPETPNLDVVPVSTLRVLDVATAPNIIPPPTICEGRDVFTRARSGRGVFADEALSAGTNGVDVEDLPQVGAFEPEVISADDPQVLVDWLNDNGYLITEAMEPFVAQYVAEGYKFLGLKLAADAGVSDIAPIKFSCPNGEAPLVPIRLTGVSAEPDMAVLVFVAGEQRYAPQNFRQLTVDTDHVMFDPATGQSNYYPLISWLLDQEGGKAFVTQYAAPSEAVQSRVDATFLGVADEAETTAYLRDVLETFPYVTRMYTRMSGWEMTDDPTFVPSEGGNVSRDHDLSGRPPVEVCAGEPDLVPCGGTYCGEGSRCATTRAGIDGCVCEEGTVARRLTAPVVANLGLAETVTCQPANQDLLSGAAITDPCDGFSCGIGGQCVPINGFPTCACDAGFAAHPSFNRGDGALECSPIDQVFETNQLLWGVLPSRFGSGFCSCVSANAPSQRMLAMLPLLALGLLLVRRRRQGASDFSIRR